jgi:hypothetical protein
MTRVVKHAGPRGPAGAAHAGRSVSPEAPGVPRRGAETRSAPPPTCGRRGAFHCAWSDAGSLPPQRTPSRELCLILRVPPTADVRAGNPAEPIPATRTAEPAPEGRRAGPTDFHSASIRPPHGRRRARLRPDPGRHGRGGGHGCRMRHPEGGGGEGGGRHGLFRSSARGLVRPASVRPVAGRGFSANENRRRVRPPRFRGDPVSQTSPWGRGAAATAWDATPVSCANCNRVPHPPSRGVMRRAGSAAPEEGLSRCRSRAQSAPGGCAAMGTNAASTRWLNATAARS